MKARYDGDGCQFFEVSAPVFTKGKIYEVVYIDSNIGEKTGTPSFLFAGDNGDPMWNCIDNFTFITDTNDEPLPERQIGQ